MASTINSEKIVLGLGALEFGRYDANGVFQSYRNAGTIKGVLTLNLEQTIAEMMTGRPQRPVKQEKTIENVTVSFTLAEMSVANLKDAIGGGIQTESVPVTFLTGNAQAPVGDLTDSYTTVVLVDKFEYGGQCDLARVALRFTRLKSCGTGKRQILECYIAQAQGPLSLPFSETDYTQFECTFRLLADLTKPTGTQFFQLLDER